MSKPALHGRDHHPARSDPLSDMIVYDYLNLGTWLSIETEGAGGSLEAGSSSGSGFTGIAMLFRTLAVDFANGGDITWSVQTGTDGGDPVGPTMSLGQNGFLYYLDGTDDGGYTEGGSFYRYTGGGDINFFTTQGDLAGAGSFFVTTSGASGTNVGSISLDSSGGDGTGNVNFSYGDDGRLEISGGGVSPVMRFDNDGTIHIQSGATIIADL